MAYCKRCGAYIPDGLSACLACGYDEAAVAPQSGAATARENQNEDFRLKYEEERRKRQEENQRWAEEERRRRDEEERRKLEDERRRLEEERHRLEQERLRNESSRRRSSYAGSASSNWAGTGARYTASDSTLRSTESTAESQDKGRGRLFGALSYLSMAWVLPYIFCKDDEFARYHARQGLGLFVFGIICDAIGVITPLIWLARFYFIYKGMMNALNDRKTPLPLFGKFFEKN